MVYVNGSISLDQELTASEKAKIITIFDSFKVGFWGDQSADNIEIEGYGDVEDELREAVSYLKEAGKPTAEMAISVNDGCLNGGFILEAGEVKYLSDERYYLFCQSDDDLVKELTRRGYTVSHDRDGMVTPAGTLYAAYGREPGYPSVDILFQPKGCSWRNVIVSAEVKAADKSEDVDIYVYGELDRDMPTHRIPISRKQVVDILNKEKEDIDDY